MQINDARSRGTERAGRIGKFTDTRIEELKPIAAPDRGARLGDVFGGSERSVVMSWIGGTPAADWRT